MRLARATVVVAVLSARALASDAAVSQTGPAPGTPVPPSPGAALTPTPAATPPPLLDLRMLRLKISAGDLPSAESILETHRAEKGDDAEALLGLAWLARGAALLDDWPAASRYAKEARAGALARLGTPPKFEDNSEAQYALGTAIEVEAQALAAAGKKDEAIRFLEASAREHEKAPYNLRARIWKRRNQLELVGRPAPGFRVEERLGAPLASLDSLRGRPVVMFLWWQACGDCKAQAPALRRIIERYTPKGVAFVAPTRYYDKDDERPAEKEKIEKALREVYAFPDSVSVPISDEAMLRYGVSATPTFVFVDRRGIVRQYLPYRMTEERLAAAIDDLLK
jgi:thiol-disulfide isomerase/thioredoxin